MEWLGAGLEGSGKEMSDLREHPFFKGVKWETISSSNELPFNKEEVISKINEYKTKN